jgi:hypothetical protein
MAANARACFYRDGFFKPMPRWDKCIGVLGDYYVEKLKNNDTSAK